jgi:uncharacterized membrane protein YgdD (TMEM256/DUF423 family)
MTDAMKPAEAREALAEMERRQQQVIDTALVPNWYWWTVALATVGLGVAVDTRDPAAIAVVAALYGVGIALLTGWIMFGGLRHVKVHERLLGSRGAGLIVGFVWLVVGGTLGLAFVLQAANVRSAGALATLACAIVLVVGGPALMRRLRAIMRRQAGVR